MFLKCKFLESIKGFSQFDISKCLDISGLFDSCNYYWKNSGFVDNLDNFVD